jgi:hypothetical protein
MPEGYELILSGCGQETDELHESTLSPLLMSCIRRDALSEMNVLNNGIYSNTSLDHCGSNGPTYWLKTPHDYLCIEFMYPTQVYIERFQVVHRRKDPLTIAETNWIMLSRKIITDFCENYKGQITTLYSS